MASVLFVNADEKTQSITLRVPTFTMVFKYLTDPAFLVGYVVLAVALVGARSAKRKLSTYDSLAANWYLWNTVVIHVMMDGLCGGLFINF